MKMVSLCRCERVAHALSRAVVLAVLLAGVSVVASAAPTQTVSGVVKDSTGAIVPGVTVHLKHALTSKALSAVTDSNGRYHFENVVSGPWEVSFAGNGFETGKNIVRVGEDPAVFNATLAASAASPAPQQNPPMPNMPGMFGR